MHISLANHRQGVRAGGRAMRAPRLVRLRIAVPECTRGDGRKTSGCALLQLSRPMEVFYEVHVFEPHRRPVGVRRAYPCAHARSRRELPLLVRQRTHTSLLYGDNRAALCQLICRLRWARARCAWCAHVLRARARRRPSPGDCCTRRSPRGPWRPVPTQAGERTAAPSSPSRPDTRAPRQPPRASESPARRSRSARRRRPPPRPATGRRR